jgi:peptidyl-prolyl cis-trans isomerase SurA
MTMRTSFNSLLLGLALCASAAWGSIEILDRVAIIVEDDIVLQSEFEQRLQQVKFTLSQQGRPAPPPTELRKLVENQLIVESLQMQMAKRAGVRISDAQLNEAVGRVAAQNGMTLEAFREEVGRQGMSYGETREQIRREMTIQQVQQGSIRSRVEISEREIDNFMQSSAGQNATSPRYHIAHIMLPVEEAAGAAEEARKRQLLDRAAADIRQGTALLVWL